MYKEVFSITNKKIILNDTTWDLFFKMNILHPLKYQSEI